MQFVATSMFSASSEVRVPSLSEVDRKSMIERASLFFESGRDCGCQKVGHFNIVEGSGTYHGEIVGRRKESKERLPTEEISHVKNRQRGSCERVRGWSSLPMVREAGINLGIEPSFYSRLPFIVSFPPSVA
jgi:hypothetical protein